MGSFSSSKKQASKAVTKAIAVGKSRHENRNNGKVHSFGTARNYEQSLNQVSNWMKANGLNQGLNRITEAQALAYLNEQSETIGQKKLDQDRQALQLVLKSPIDRVKSDKLARLANQPRAYSFTQLKAIVTTQNAQHAFSTALAYAAGLRAHELFTIQTVNDQPPSSHRTWSNDRFIGRSGERYTVVGKGGLVREVILPKELAEKLESKRLEAPQVVIDRGVKYTQHYALSGGQNWSQSFTKASQNALTFSNGAHGVRHSYAQERMNEIQSRGGSYRASLEIVAQEMGHFRSDITEVYLR
jgi:integrase